MEIIKSPVYFDTNIFIYAIDGHEEYQDLLQNIFEYIAENKMLVITSELTLAECLVKPMRDENREAIGQYTNHIKTSELLKVKAVSRNILISSADARNKLGLKLPDAIHMATAIDQECKTFVTNDRKLTAPEGMERIYIKDLL
jgi:predicted nucleic acid-binding protein